MKKIKEKLIYIMEIKWYYPFIYSFVFNLFAFSSLLLIKYLDIFGKLLESRGTEFLFLLESILFWFLLVVNFLLLLLLISSFIYQIIKKKWWRAFFVTLYSLIHGSISAFNVGSLLILFLITTFNEGCGGSSFPSFSSDELKEDSVIEAYHQAHFSTTLAKEPKDNPAVYVDLCNGITEFALADENNLNVFKMLFNGLSAAENTEYHELSEDIVILYEGNKQMDYFTKSGHFQSDGKTLKIGAPIDSAINRIVDRDNVGVLITDGELYNKEAGKVSSQPWASKALEKWMNKGHELAIVYTDFIGVNKGKSFDKHMYVMFFVPNNQTLLLDNYISDLDEEGVKYEKLSFSTNTNDLFERDYPNSQLPCSPTYLEYFGEPLSYYRSNSSAMEYIDMTNAYFNFYEEGLVPYLRDFGNPNTGKEENYPLFDKLYFEFSSLTNYKVNSVDIVVHSIYEDFSNYKRNILARNNLPVLKKDSLGNDLKSDKNYLMFEGMAEIDGELPYDTSNVTVADTAEGFISILKNEFKFNKTKFLSTDKGVQDFLFIDNSAGEISEINDKGKYEIIIKFDSKLNENNAFLNTNRNNLFRIDVILDVVTNPINKKALTWNKIDGSGIDDALYRSLKNIMKKENVKPNGVVYSFYLKLGPFNNQ